MARGKQQLEAALARLRACVHACVPDGAASASAPGSANDAAGVFEGVSGAGAGASPWGVAGAERSTQVPLEGLRVQQQGGFAAAAPEAAAAALIGGGTAAGANEAARAAAQRLLEDARHLTPSERDLLGLQRDISEEELLWCGQLINAPSAAAAAMAFDSGPLEPPVGARAAVASAWCIALSAGLAGSGGSKAAAASVGVAAAAGAAVSGSTPLLFIPPATVSGPQLGLLRPGVNAAFDAGGGSSATAARHAPLLSLMLPAGGVDENMELLQDLVDAMHQLDTLMARQAALDLTYVWAVLHMVTPVQRARTYVASWPRW